MIISNIEIERFSITSSNPFEAVVAAIKAAVGHPNMKEFLKATKGGLTFAELESAVHKGLGKSGLMMFMELYNLDRLILPVNAKIISSV